MVSKRGAMEKKKAMAHSADRQFFGSDYGMGSDYGSDSYGSDSYGSDSYGSDYGSDSYGSDYGSDYGFNYGSGSD